jgi:transposase
MDLAKKSIAKIRTDKEMFAMDQNKLFGMALGLQSPWYVVKIEFDSKEKRLDIYLDFPKGSVFNCPKCGEKSKAYDTEDKVWRHLNFFQHECYLHARVPRTDCHSGENCGIRLIEVPWARPQSGFTLLFEAFLMALVQAMPVNTVATLVKETDKRLWRMLTHYVEKARQNVDMSEVTAVGIDETSSRKRHKYITCFVDLKESKILYSTEGKGETTTALFKEDLKQHGGDPEKITDACCDLSPSFISGVQKDFPNAALIFDRFHVMKIINDAVDKVRREESKNNPILKGTRYLWLKNERNLTEKQRKQFESIRKLRCKTAKAYQLKVTFQEFFSQPDKESAEALLNKWYSWARRCRIEPMKQAAMTVHNHRQGILNWFDSRISNGVLEGINSLLQAAKARARGYRSTTNFITMAYMIAGKLSFDLPT